MTNTTFEDIVSDIETNGGTVTDVTMYDSSADISYIDSSGTSVSKHYKITINDDGSENWAEV